MPIALLAPLFFFSQVPNLPLLAVGSRLALIRLDRVQHNLIRILRVIVSITLAPVVADGVGKDCARVVEVGRGDGAADLGVALETVLGVLVPEVKGSVATGCAERAVLGMEGDCVDCVDVCDVALIGHILAMTPEGEV